ncbi:nitroreductase family deazaflavin-dependent oxidoreductase [Myxococcota bacterium]|nr:nitroreductase family deazaflavin-dependent oxidoreductase [Myxococcota bacterium]
MIDETLLDEMPEWLQQHARSYLETDGKVGHMWDSTVVGGPGPVPCLLLTTLGRKTGKKRLLPLIYGTCEAGVVVVASKGGAPTHPVWYLNLVDNPEVDVQVEADCYRAKARVAQGEERNRLWDMMVGVWAAYTGYQEKTEREIPVVVLERV